MNRTAISSAICTLVALAAALLPSVASATIIVSAPKDSTKFIASTSVFNNFSIANDGGPLGSRVYTGKFDLTNNDLIVNAATEATALSNFANVNDMVRSGYDGGDWAGNGLTSSIADTDAAGNGTTSLGFPSPGITALGVILNDDGSHANPDGSGFPIWTTWDGRVVNQYSVLVKYTFYGDTLLRGRVDLSDEDTVAANFGSGAHWADGVFDYDGGPVDSADLDRVSSSLALESEYGVPGPKVPEPQTLVLAACGLFAAALSAPRFRSCSAAEAIGSVRQPS
jgi:hypothetical protein